ncbi:MAG: type III pantothenate kinase [Gammaproteobacteria bacterium]|nr:type III pantothenate kinase [Gammaproteobacteria bacterium]
MAVIASLDLGNTRLKWWLDGPEWSDHGAISNDALESGLRALPWSVITEVRIASVRDRSTTTAIAVLVDSLSAPSCDVRQVISREWPGLLTFPSTDLGQMGVDRYLAMLAAASAEPDSDSVVIDAGTAMTLDIVIERVHQGGYIVPGQHLAWQSLVAQTDRIQAPKDALYDAKLGPGTVTHTCVDHGIRLALVSLCRQVIIDQMGAANCLVWVTGGAGAWLVPHLPGAARYQPDLVKRGMDRYFSLCL